MAAGWVLWAERHSCSTSAQSQLQLLLRGLTTARAEPWAWVHFWESRFKEGKNCCAMGARRGEWESICGEAEMPIRVKASHWEYTRICPWKKILKLSYLEIPPRVLMESNIHASWWWETYFDFWLPQQPGGSYTHHWDLKIRFNEVILYRIAFKSRHIYTCVFVFKTELCDFCITADGWIPLYLICWSHRSLFHSQNILILTSSS